MLRLKLVLCSLFLIGFQFKGTAQGMEFAKGTWAEIVQKAKQENKAIFVDVYTDWCGPCRVMAAQVFTLPEVGEKYNKRYINVKIDAEKGEGIALAAKYVVEAYPTYLFIDPQTEKLIGRGKSAMPIQDFQDLGDENWTKFLGQPNPSLEVMQARFASQTNLDNEFMQTLIKKLKKEKKSSLKEVDYYLDHFVLQNYSEDNLFFLASNFSQGNSRLYDYIVDNYPKVDRVMRARDGLAAANVDRTLNYEITRYLSSYTFGGRWSDAERKELLEKTYAAIRSANVPSEAEKMILENQRAYYSKLKDKENEVAVFKELINKYVLPDKYTNTLKRQVVVIDKNNYNPEGRPDSVHSAGVVRTYADQLLKLDSSTESVKLAMQLLDKSQRLTPQTAYYTNVKNMLQYNLGDQKKAIKAQRSLVKEMTKKNDRHLNNAVALLAQMNAKEATLKFTSY